MSAPGVTHSIQFDDRSIGVRLETAVESRAGLIRHVQALNTSLGQVAMTARMALEGDGGGVLDQYQQGNQVHGLMTAVELMSSMVEALLEEATGMDGAK